MNGLNLLTYWLIIVWRCRFRSLTNSKLFFIVTFALRRYFRTQFSFFNVTFVLCFYGSSDVTFQRKIQTSKKISRAVYVCQNSLATVKGALATITVLFALPGAATCTLSVWDSFYRSIINHFQIKNVSKWFTDLSFIYGRCACRKQKMFKASSN